MKEYFWGVTLTCISAAIVKAAAEESSSKKYIDSICSLCVVCALVLPVLPMISYIDGYEIDAFFDENSLTVMESDGTQIYNGYLQSVSVEQTENSIEDEICSQLFLEVGEVDVKLIWEESDGGILLTEAAVYLYGDAVSKEPSVIKEYIENKTGVRCRIIY